MRHFFLVHGPVPGRESWLRTPVRSYDGTDVWPNTLIGVKPTIRAVGYREFRRPRWPNGPDRWLAAGRQHRVKLSLLSFGRTYSFGAMPGEGEPYGFSSVDAQGALYTVVNPSQSVRTVPLPRVHLRQAPVHRSRVLFRDDGFAPRLADDMITLGPEQLAVVGFGEYEVPCSAEFALR